ncbi:MAG: hypothetical protein KDK75_17755 [Alphaproteobacteria bacterium]|nr:hypothetical protein [Alphaproteobacteria bacterium]
MKTLTATIALSIMFLSAGAFAGDRNQSIQPSQGQTENVTVVYKNQAWPQPDRITVDPCKINQCYDI